MQLPRSDLKEFAVIGLGGNLDQPEQRVVNGYQRLLAVTGIEEVAFSSLYRSRPMGPKDQPDYVNAVLAVETTLRPLDLLDQLQAIELHEGRVRSGERWGARTLDLDLLMYGAQSLEHPRLTVPHKGLSEREFVLYPLFEILPDLKIPGLGSVRELVARCPKNGLERLSS